MISQEDSASQPLEQALYVQRRSFQRGNCRGGRCGGRISRLKFPIKHYSYCYRNGHTTEDDCWARQYDEEHNVTTKQPHLSINSSSSCDYCGQSNHPSHMCFKRRSDADCNRAYATKHHDNIVTILSNKDGLDCDQTCISLIEYSQHQE